MTKRALITGISGQDGSYLAEYLLAKGYVVYGIVRRSSSLNTARLDAIYEPPTQPEARLRLVYGDLADAGSLTEIIRESAPDEIYHLGAQTHVKVSFEMPTYTGDITALGTTRVLDAARVAAPNARIYQASSSEMFGAVLETPQRETTPFRPRSPYGAAKAYAYWMAVNYRESYGMHVSNGILFNHESPRRGTTFVTRKITRAVAAIKFGMQSRLQLGNLEARRDWGFAGDYVEAMWLMTQQDHSGDFVIATGQQHSVREFLEEAFVHAGLDWRQHVEVEPRYFRPCEVDSLLGDAGKARRELGWEPRVGFQQLVHMMVDSDLEETRCLVQGHGPRARVAAHVL